MAVSTVWRWSNLGPLIGTDKSRDLAYQSIDRFSPRLTPGGVASRLVGQWDDAVFLLVSRFIAAALKVDESARAALAIHLPSAVQFTPLSRSDGKYILSSPGVVKSRSCAVDGVELPASDIRRDVLRAEYPSFTLSSILNVIDEFYSQTDWLAFVDQVDGSIYVSESPVSYFHSALAVPGITVEAIFESEGREGTL